MKLKIKITVHSFTSAEQRREKRFTYENITTGEIVNSYLPYL